MTADEYREIYAKLAQAQQNVYQAQEDCKALFFALEKAGCPTCHGAWDLEYCQLCSETFLRCEQCQPPYKDGYESGYCEGCIPSRDA